MALPESKPNDKVKSVEAKVEKLRGEELAALPDLDEDDLKVLGTLVQYFAFMDFNLRRALEIFHKAKMIPKEYQKAYPSHPDAHLTDCLLKIIKAMDPKDENADLAAIWIKVIDTTRANRNVAAHFAGKRFPNEDVYVFVSKSNRDAKRVFGFDLAEHEVHLMVVDRTGFAEAAQAAKDALDWLVPKVSAWHARYSGEKPAQAPA